MKPPDGEAQAVGNVKYSFIAISPRSTQIWRGCSFRVLSLSQIEPTGWKQMTDIETAISQYFEPLNCVQEKAPVV